MLNAFAAGEVVTPESLACARPDPQALAAASRFWAMANLKAALTVRAHAFSKSAEEKITRAGGKVERLS